MLTRTETAADDGAAVWARLAAPHEGPLDSRAVLRRLDEAAAGEWDVTLDLLPAQSDDAPCAFKARLQILGVIREHVGVGKTYRDAATNAFLAAARMFRVGGDRTPAAQTDAAPSEPTPARAVPTNGAPDATRTSEQACPKCGGPCHDNRATKRNPKAPDYRCKDRTCTGCIWPPNSRGARVAADAAAGREAA